MTAGDDVRVRDAVVELRSRGENELAALVQQAFDEREATRRQLSRLGFDLHDGPLQSVVALSADLRHFQWQLETLLADVQDGEKLVARVDDLVARVLAIGEDLRDSILGSDTSSLLQAPISDALAGVADAYTGFAIELSIDPTVDELALSDSQRIALVRVVKGALDNIDQHSGATLASITVRRSSDDGVVAEVADDGSGFDVEQTSRSGQGIGLVAMRERVQLLDGELRVESRPGGPTRIALTLPPWRQPHDER